ncbi:PIN domain-containing protein [Streptomyces sp. ET3-23]|uniref:type II toxin-antitoxin system VapC family toxin n=1 Tax=Streptomyces sp. ET3-23 TaxID=2885643 RepID=UPI001D125762|nr:PIN domain-containing protein [Streptomyces sp. ET3-23]MCC2280746.1 PIN domain-containing protein [Streptomyces sp. ET3-23]
MSGIIPAVVADTSVLLAVYDRKDEHHERCVAALSHVGMLVVSPMVLVELDYHLHRRVGTRAAIEAAASLGAWAGVGRAEFVQVTRPLHAEAVELMRTYADHAIGLTDALNAVIAWRLP